MLSSETSVLPHTVQILDALRPGDRGWFWFCATAPLTERFVLTTFGDDPRMSQMLKLTAPLGVGEQTHTGMVQVDDAGRLRLATDDAEPFLLEALAAYALALHEEHPSLRRLRGTSVIEVLTSGLTVFRLEDDALWAELPAAVVPGTMAETAQTIATLVPEEQAWFWLSGRGVGGQPFLSMIPTKSDPDGALFSARIGALRRRMTEPGKELRGVAQRLPSGRLLFTTTEPSKLWRPFLAAVLRTHVTRHPELQALSTAAVSMMTDGKLGDLHSFLDVAQTINEIKQVVKGEPARFWLTPEGVDGQAHLIVRQDKGALRREAFVLAGNGPVLTGKLTAENKKFIFSSANALPDAGPDATLSAWVTANIDANPGLRRLSRADFLVQ